MSDIEAPPQSAADRIGTEPISRLLLRFSLPAITGMLVNALYNVVDRIFVGRWVDETALGGLTLVMPLMVISMAFSMLFGVGSANMISMRLGQGRKQEAEATLNHCVVLLAIIGAVIMCLGLFFTEDILSIMGARSGSQSLEYAKSYFRVILFGLIFFQMGFGLSHCTRAQGFPKITMIGMILGAVMNIILDALFIIVFGWGVEGAAWATIISQFSSFIWIISFSLSKKAVVRLRLSTFRPSLQITYEIMGFGSSSFIMQASGSFVIILFNNILNRLGPVALGVSNGGDIALSGWSIVSTFTMLIFMPVIGINQGAQPILGYNYGAKKFDRVRKTYILAILAATCIATFGFLMVQIFPIQLVRLFVPDGSPALLSFAPIALRIHNIMTPLCAFLVMSSNFFVVTGRPRTSITLNMLRQVIVLVPCAIIFGNVWGLWGFMASLPTTEAICILITGVFMFFEMKKLNRQIKEGASVGVSV
ncbi:MAG: MATE family efflux transporter [Treponema sp.]|nr:MATE family efflux transporter [Treponema sp.]